MKKNNFLYKISNKITIILLFIVLLFLSGCQVTLEQGEQLEKNKKFTEATQLYWEIIKGDTATYPLETKQKAYNRILQLKDPAIIPEFETEILSNEDISSQMLICDLIIAYESTPDYKCIILAGLDEKLDQEQRSYYASSLSKIKSEEIDKELMNMYADYVEKHNATIQEKLNQGITQNLTSMHMFNYYQFLALYDSEETLAFLLGLLEEDAEDMPSLIQAMQLIKDTQVIDSLLKVSKKADAESQKVITDIFIRFNEPKTYSYLIEQAVANDEDEDKILKHLEDNLTTANLKYFAETFKANNYQPNAKPVIIAKNFIKTIPSKESVSLLSKLLHLKNINKNEATNAEIQDILRFINQNMTKDNLSDLLFALEKNLSITPTADYYALDDLFQQNIVLINKFYSNNEYLKSFMLDLKILASVYKAKESFAFLVQKARSSESLDTIKLLLEDIVVQTNTVTQSPPASKILNNVLFYMSRIEDANLKKMLASVIKSSNFERKIAIDDMQTLPIPAIIPPTPTITNTDSINTTDNVK